uniref:Uncharacterized protein n=1 Tax=Romanomermis culicivorax TaxID=13658 RepID=A0A915L5T9_ROMCU
YQLNFVYNAKKFSINTATKDHLIGWLIKHCKDQANVKLIMKHFNDGTMEVLLVAEWDIDEGD